MAAQASEILQWFIHGAEDEDKPKFMIVWCDTYDFDDYPAYYATAEAAQEALDNPSSMQRAMEVYDLSQPREAQMKLSRCWALTKGGRGVVKDVSLSQTVHPSHPRLKQMKKLIDGALYHTDGPVDA